MTIQQQELANLNLDADKELVLENEKLISKVDEYLTDLSQYIDKIKHEKVSDPAIEKIASLLEIMNKNTSNTDRLAETLNKKLEEKDEKLFKLMDTIIQKNDGSAEIKSRTQLPKLFIKKFYGDILEWPSFLDSFNSAIGCHPLDKSEKFNYLSLFLVDQLRKPSKVFQFKMKVMIQQ